MVVRTFCDVCDAQFTQENTGHVLDAAGGWLLTVTVSKGTVGRQCQACTSCIVKLIAKAKPKER